MASQRTTFATALALTVAGLAIMLYGVTLNSGQAPNAPVAVGGTVVLVAFAILTAGVLAVDERSEAA